MKGAELMRLSTGSAGVDVVLEAEDGLDSGKVRLVLDHHANGTAESAELTFADMLRLRATLSMLIRQRRGKVPS